MELKTLREKAKALKPVLRIGKLGLTDSVINEIKLQLKKKKLIKIKLLRSALAESSKETVFQELIEKTGAVLISKIGFMITIYKDKNHNI